MYKMRGYSTEEKSRIEKFGHVSTPETWKYRANKFLRERKLIV